MNIEFITENDLIIVFSGELDHISATQNKERLEMKTATTHLENIVLDFNGLTFMDSSAISLVYSLYKTAQELSKKVSVVTSNERFIKILTLAGMQEFVKIVPDYEKCEKHKKRSEGGSFENGNN